MKAAAAPRRPRTKPATTAYSYTRFSSLEQRKGDSFRRQLEAARAYAGANGLTLDESLRDEGVSAYRGRHRDEKAALGAFLKRVEAGGIPKGSYLLVESLDRLSREEVLDALELFLGITRAGITIVTLIDQRKYSRASLREDYTQLLISIVLMSRAHEESSIKSKRVADAWAMKRRRASENQQAMTARAPGWIRLVGGPRTGRYELITERAAVVRQIFADTIAGIGRRTIAQRLNEQGAGTWGTGKRKGQFWHDSYIQRIVSSPATFGTFTPNLRASKVSERSPESPIANYFPAAIDEATYWEAQAASKLRGSGKGRTGKRNNLLSGLVKCEACKGTMIFIDKGKRSGGPSLRCGRAHASAGCDHRAYYNYQRIEIGVIGGLGKLQSSLIEAASGKISQLDQLLSSTATKHDAVTARLNNLIELVAAGGSGPTVAAQVANLEAEKDAIQREVDRLRRESRQSKAIDTAAATSKLIAVYKTLQGKSGDELSSARAVLQQRLKMLIEKVEITPSGFIATHNGGTRSKMFFPARKA
jgi:DNA invertase Pin-like site-specific DNA recombinase